VASFFSNLKPSKAFSGRKNLTEKQPKTAPFSA